MQGKIGLEEHFAIPETLNDSKGFLGDGTWPELESRLMDIQTRRLGDDGLLATWQITVGANLQADSGKKMNVMEPDGVSLPILGSSISVNHTLPSFA